MPNGNRCLLTPSLSLNTVTDRFANNQFADVSGRFANVLGQLNTSKKTKLKETLVKWPNTLAKRPMRLSWAGRLAGETTTIPNTTDTQKVKSICGTF